MMTVKQVSSLTGVSVRTLQFYDEIGLLKPTKVTDAGYRLYDERTLDVLQQILFFKELDFSLKEIKTVLKDPRFDRAVAFEKQREVLKIKRDRLNALLELLDKLIKGEKCMNFKVFDMSEYFRVLDDFKKTHRNEIVSRFGSVEQFDEMVSKLKSQESEIAEAAVKSYGSVESYTKSMEKSLESFLSEGPAASPSEVRGLIEKTESLTKKLTADLSKDPASKEIQEILEELIAFTNECGKGVDMGENYWESTAENYMTNPVYLKVNDKKYGDGASNFIGRALKAYLHL